MTRKSALFTCLCLAVPSVAMAQPPIILDSPFKTGDAPGQYGTAGSAYREGQQLDNDLKREVLQQLQDERQRREFNDSPVGHFIRGTPPEDAAAEAIGQAVFDALSRH